MKKSVKSDRKNPKTAKKPEEIPAMENSAQPPASDDSENIDPIHPVRSEVEKALSSIAWTSNGVNQCVYCTSRNIVKRGKRKNKLEEVQLYLCQDCGRTFTGKKIKGKKYPTRMILDGVSYYNVGFSLEESAKFLERINFGG